MEVDGALEWLMEFMEDSVRVQYQEREFVANGPQLSGQNAQNRVEEEDEQVFEGKLVERAVQEQDDTEDGVIENDAANGEN